MEENKQIEKEEIFMGIKIDETNNIHDELFEK